MKKIDHMAEESLKDRSAAYISDKDKKKLSGAIASAAAALVFFAAGLLLSRFAPDQTPVAELLYLISVLIIGIPVLVTAVKGFLHKDVSASMEILVSVAMVVAVLDGQFVVAILIPVILTVVHFFEEKSIMGGRDAIEGLKQMQARTALLFANGQEREVDITNKANIFADVLAGIFERGGGDVYFKNLNSTWTIATCMLVMLAYDPDTKELTDQYGATHTLNR